MSVLASRLGTLSSNSAAVNQAGGEHLIWSLGSSVLPQATENMMWFNCSNFIHPFLFNLADFLAQKTVIFYLRVIHVDV